MLLIWMIEVGEYLDEDGRRERDGMALTRDFRETVQARVRRDSDFRRALLEEGVRLLLAGDVETGKAVLRDYINATIGFADWAS